jgi:hypothetical protein
MIRLLTENPERGKLLYLPLNGLLPSASGIFIPINQPED